VSNAGRVGKNFDSRRISGYRSIDDCCSTNNNCDSEHAVYFTDRHTSVILFITTGMDDHDEEKITEENLIVCSGKSEAEVTNNRRLRSTFVLWRSIVRPLCNSRATCDCI